MRSIIMGALFVFGGVSGGMVLRGTGSSGALALVGVVMIVIGVVQVASKGGADSGSEGGSVNFSDPERDQEQMEEYQRSKVALASKSGRPALPADITALIAATPGAAAEIKEVLDRTKGHLDAAQTQEMVAATAKRLAADHRRRQQAGGV